MKLSSDNSILILEQGGGGQSSTLWLAQGMYWGQGWGTFHKVVSLQQGEIHIVLAEVPNLKRLAYQDRPKP